MAKISTAMFGVAGGDLQTFLTGCTGGDTCIDTITDKDDLAATVLAMEDSMCGENGMFKSDSDTCQGSNIQYAPIRMTIIARLAADNRVKYFNTFIVIA